MADEETSADVEAARAAASAQTAAEAAAAATVIADANAARAGQDAAERMAQFEGKISEWQTQTAALRADLEADRSSRATHASLMEEKIGSLSSTLQSIQAKLEKPTAPDPPSPKQPPTAEDQPAPEPEPAPAKKKAHRWI